MPFVDLVVFLGIEDPSERRLHTEHREVVARHQLGVDALRLVVHAQRGRDDPAAEHFSQRFGFLLQILIQRIRVHPRAHVAAHVRAALVEHDQLLGRRDRQLAQQNLVDQREDGRIGTDAEGERQNRHRRKQWTAAKSPDCQAQVGQRAGHIGSWTD